MTRPIDTGSRTEADAAAWERHFGPDYDDDHRPTRAELDRDEYDETDDDLADAGYVSTVAFLLAVIVGSLLVLALWAGGQRVVCWMNDDAVRYCPGYAGEPAR